MASVEIIVAEVHVPGSRSLKDKRRVIKSIVDRSHQRLRVSVAETGLHDVHQRAELTFAIVLAQGGTLSEELRRHLELDPSAMISGWHTEVIDLV